MSHQAPDDAVTGGHTASSAQAPEMPSFEQAVAPQSGGQLSFQHSDPQTANTQPSFDQPSNTQPSNTQPSFDQPSFAPPASGTGAPVYPSFQPATGQQFGAAPQGMPAQGSGEAYAVYAPGGAGAPQAQAAPLAQGTPYAQYPQAPQYQGAQYQGAQYAPAPGAAPYGQAQQGYVAAGAGATPARPPYLDSDLPPENVGRGLLYSLGGVLVGVVAAILLYRMGLISSITTYLMALAVLRLYVVGSGGRVRRGAAPVILLLLLGVVLTIMGYVGSDAFRYYGEHAGKDAAVSRASFVWHAMTTGSIYGDYGKDIAMTILFAALGLFSTIRMLLRPGRRR